MFTFSVIWFWLAVIAQIVVGFLMNVEWFYYVAGSVVVIRWLFLALVLHFIAKKISLKVAIWAYPFWEFCYISYQIIVGFIALTSSKVAWK
jgi:hypothetical protein